MADSAKVSNLGAEVAILAAIPALLETIQATVRLTCLFVAISATCAGICVSNVSKSNGTSSRRTPRRLLAVPCLVAVILENLRVRIARRYLSTIGVILGIK